MSTFLPFLYQTRTLQKGTSKTAHSAFRSFHASRIASTRSRPRESSIPFEWDGQTGPGPSKEDIFFQSRDAVEPDPELLDEQRPASTITPSEQRAFRQIFDNIAKQKGASASFYAAKLFEKTETTSFPSHRNAEPAHHDADSPDWMLRYPPSLREDVRRALNLHSAEVKLGAESEVQEEDEDYPKTRLLQKWQTIIRQRAVQSMESLLGECKTDVEILNLMEREVFSLVKELGISERVGVGNKQDHEETPMVTTKGSGEEAQQSGLETKDLAAAEEMLEEMASVEETNKDAAQTPREQVARAVKEAAGNATLSKVLGPWTSRTGVHTYGQLYPIHLVQCLKALDEVFCRPSPLVLRVLPRIRELGLASYVLGASTAFYNELAVIMWRRRGDVRGVINLLQEMQYAGLQCDEQTLDLILEIEAFMDAMSEGQQGRFLQSLSTMPGYDLDIRARLGRFANKIEPTIRRG